MLTFYCTHCWAVVEPKARTCPSCGNVLSDDRSDLTDKYIAALRHPQPETRLRAAWMLGRMRAKRAISALVALVIARGDHDPYVLSAALRSLGQIGDQQAVPVLADLLNDSTAPFMARVEAAHALATIGGTEAETALEWAAQHDTNERVRHAAAQRLSKDTLTGS